MEFKIDKGDKIRPIEQHYAINNSKKIVKLYNSNIWKIK